MYSYYLKATIRIFIRVQLDEIGARSWMTDVRFCRNCSASNKTQDNFNRLHTHIHYSSNVFTETAYTFKCMRTMTTIQLQQKRTRCSDLIFVKKLARRSQMTVYIFSH